MATNTIGRIAARAGVHVETIRFYERRGLIRRPERPAHGFREYPEAVVDRLRFIRHAKALGFTLREIRDLLSLRTRSGQSCDAVKRRAEAKIEDVERKMASLARLKTQLQRLTHACDRRTGTGDCPILEALQ